MKGNQKIIACLNGLLSGELAAINQYIVQSEVCENMGYKKLHDAIKKQALDEMKHAERLIARIMTLEGKPMVDKLDKIHIGKSIEEQIRNDRHSEQDAIKLYNAGIQLARNENDEGTAELLSSILSDEERHHEWLASQADQIEQIGLQKYLAVQID